MEEIATLAEKQKAHLVHISTDFIFSGNNFVKTMLRLMAEKKCLNVIDEQIGTPTWAHGLAKAIWTGVQKNISGTFHWTDAGVASWYDFAVAIQEEGIDAGLLDTEIPVLPVRTDRFPTPAKRPLYSVLDKTATWEALGISPIHWRKQLRAMLKESL